MCNLHWRLEYWQRQSDVLFLSNPYKLHAEYGAAIVAIGSWQMLETDTTVEQTTGIATVVNACPWTRKRLFPVRSSFDRAFQSVAPTTVYISLSICFHFCSGFRTEKSVFAPCIHGPVHIMYCYLSLWSKILYRVLFTVQSCAWYVHVGRANRFPRTHKNYRMTFGDKVFRKRFFQPFMQMWKLPDI